MSGFESPAAPLLHKVSEIQLAAIARAAREVMAKLGELSETRRLRESEGLNRTKRSRVRERAKNGSQLQS